jgi:protease-4
MGLSDGHGSFDEFVDSAGRLLNDHKRVGGVLVRFGSAHLGLAQATEIGVLLARMGERIPVWCHADDLTNATLYLESTGCRRMWMAPSGTVDAVGLGAELIYFHKFLSERLGLDVDFLQVGKYKGAEEPFTRDGPSPEARASIESMLRAQRSAWSAGILRGHPQTAEGAIEDGPYAAPRARELGLVDTLGYFDEARSAMEREVGADGEAIRFGPGQPLDSVADVLRGASGWLGDAPVAVVRAVGAISVETEGMFGTGGIVERRLNRTFARLAKDDRVKAVVVRIDSPGGSALASDLLWHSMMTLRAKKPVVVSIGDMAASGGYYMASAASRIFAEETSIIGSIGVVGGKIAVGRALEGFGVHGETLSGKGVDAHASTRAAFESPMVAWDEPTRQRVLSTMIEIYRLFLSRVSEGRGMSVERVAQSAEGRLFAGRESLERGLVDELGGLTEAIAHARSLAGLPPDSAVETEGTSGGWLETLVDRGQDTPNRAAMGLAMEGLALSRSELVPFLASVTPIGRNESTVCALPFALTLQ